jgi:solute carrier family 25 uncoupling protein 8/9
VTIPIDQAKVRLQLQHTTVGHAPKYNGMLNTIYKIASEESVMSLYRGLTPGLQRQFVNCSVRFGAYEHVSIKSIFELRNLVPQVEKAVNDRN